MATVEKARREYDNAVQSNQYSKWLKRTRKSYNFYEGKQFTEEELSLLNDRNQPAIVVNRIAVNVDNIIGQEITTRTRVAFRSRSFDQRDKMLGSALTHMGYYIQEQEDTSYKLSLRNKDRLIGGIGWLERDLDQNSLKYNLVDPFEMVWDVSDLTQKLTDSRHLFRQRWVDIEEAVQEFPDKEEELRALMDAETGESFGELPVNIVRDQDFNGVNTYTGFADSHRNRVKVIEWQYKVPATKYEVLTKENRVIETFDEDEANKFAMRDENNRNRVIEGAINEVESYQVWSMFWTDNIELSNAPLLIQNGSFSYLPSLYKRDTEGVPYGLVEAAIPPQQEMNKRRSKLMHLLNSNRIVMDIDAVDDPNVAADEASRPDGVIMKKRGTELQLTDLNQREAAQQFQMLQRSEREIDMVMGVFAESLGQQTNAVSGLAIQQRQLASNRNQISSLDNHRADRREFGRDLLAAIQAAFTRERVAIITDDDELTQEITLNQRTTIDGHEAVINDIRTAELDIVVEEVPEYNAPREEVAQLVQQIMMNGQGAMLTQPEILGILGVSPNDATRIANAFGKALQASPQPGEAATPAAEGQSAASPSPLG